MREFQSEQPWSYANGMSLIAEDEESFEEEETVYGIEIITHTEMKDLWVDASKYREVKETRYLGLTIIEDQA